MLEVRNLEISFFNGKKQIRRTDRVSFCVEPGEIVALVGESGCGKSITALSVMGLLSRQGRVTGGEILYEGKNLLAMSEKELDAIRGRDVAMIFQDIMYSLNPVFTIGSQMIEGMRRHLGLGRNEAREKAIALLERTGIQNAPALDNRDLHAAAAKVYAKRSGRAVCHRQRISISSIEASLFGDISSTSTRM